MTKEKYLKYILFGILFGLLFFLILSILTLSSVPPVSRDALTHHLAVPKLYLQHGGMYEIPLIKYSYYPMNLELLYLIPLYFGNDIIPKWIHFLFALGTTLIIFMYLKKRLNVLYGLFGSLFFLSIPIIVKLSTTAYVDLGLLFFSTASLILFFRWAEEDFKLRHIILSAICCGLALGTKYNGLIVLCLITLFVPFVYIQGNSSGNRIEKSSLLNQSKAVGYGFVFFIVSLIIFSPWMTRNYLWKKNPIYPLYHNIIGYKEINSREQNQKSNNIIMNKDSFIQIEKSRWNHFIIRRIIYKETWGEIAFIPIRIFYEGEDGIPKKFDGKLNIFLILLPIFYFIFRREDNVYLKSETHILLIFSIAYFIFTFVSKDMRIRYIAPIIPPLVILSLFGLKRIHDLVSKKFPQNRNTYLNYIIASVVALLMIGNLSYLIKQFKYVKPFEYISRKINRDDYITRFRPEYPTLQYANNRLSMQSKILGVFMGNRRYYCQREIIFSNNLLFSAIKSTNNTQIIFNSLKEKSITHIIIWQKYYIRWAEINLTKDELATLHLFYKKYTRLLFDSGGYRLYELIDIYNN